MRSAWVFAAAVFVTTPACMSLDGLADTDGPPTTKGATITTASAKTCSAATVKIRDGFEGRSSPAAVGWAKGRVSDAMPLIAMPEKRWTAILTSSVAATTEKDGKSTSYIDREIPAMGCMAAEFSVRYTEAAPFPDDAWTYFFWFDAADDRNISMFRMGNVVRLAVQNGGTEVSRMDVDVPPNKWTKLKVEVDLSLPRPTVSIRVNTEAARRMDVTEPLDGPYFVSIGTWARGAVPAHEFFYDDVMLSY